MQNILEGLRLKMSENDIDAVILMDGANRRYFSGFTGSSGTAFITKDASIFMTDSRYTIQCKQQCTGFEVKELYGKLMLEFIGNYCTENSVKNIWIDEDMLSYNQYKAMNKVFGENVEFKEGSKFFSEIRAVKSESEAVLMKEAAVNSDKAFLKALDEFKVGMTELDLATMFEKNVLDLGDKISFIIVASGENAALPHHEPNARVINYGDIVTVDYGVIHKGYNSDCTRTFAVGEIPEELVKIHAIVKRAQAEAAKAVAPGKVCCELDKIARDIITEEGYGECFGHSLGHGVGLDIHELPSLSKMNESVLAPGMFVTVEPGIYVEGLGGVRIEDTLMVTEDGAVSITDMVPKCLYIKEF